MKMQQWTRSSVSCLCRCALIPALLLGTSAFSKTLSNAEINADILKLQNEIKAKGLHFTVGRTGVAAYSIDELCGLDLEKQQRMTPPPEPRSMQKSLAVLPAAYDLRAM